jgi:photosystem II stability/assembly factor-like uncharacterized protein
LHRLLFSIVVFFILSALAHHSLKKQPFASSDLYAPLDQSNSTRSLEKPEGKTDEPSKFLLFHAGIRTREGDSGPTYETGYKWRALASAKQHAMRLRAAGRTKSNGVLEWKERGPANVPGRTRALFNVPGDPSNKTWLAGAATGGIWRTTDGGNTWSDRSAEFPVLPISCFAADQSATVIYAGTGEHVSSFYSAIGNGIFKSTDKGVTWSQLSSTNNHEEFGIVTRIAVDPVNPFTIVATTAPHNVSADNSSSIMRSSDGGVTWTKVLEVTGILEQVIATHGNFNKLYAAEHGVGVWKSSDGGLTWTLSNRGMSPEGRIELAVSSFDPRVIFASAEGTLSGSNSDLYYSSDEGATWSLVDVRFNGAVIDFLEGQGYYDNTIVCDPFDANKFYVGGVSLFRVAMTSGFTEVKNYKLIETGTSSFLLLQSFAGIPYDHQRLNTGADAQKINVELRFGPGLSQKAHRFMVPPNRTNGLVPNDYGYQNYVDVPFQVWDITNNQQLMVSFRDQNRNGKFDLVPPYVTNNGLNYLANSREYLYIHNLAYSITAHTSVAKSAGHEYKMMYNVFPALTPGATWNEAALPASKIKIEYQGLKNYNATTTVVADGRGMFDKKNKANQEDLSAGVHADHHCLVPIITDQSLKRYKLLLGSDGGVFVSKESTDPGIVEGDWQFKGFGLNTGQFYGADKKPGAEQYIGGLQDNGTRISESKKSADVVTNYTFAIDGDGFEVIWNNADPSKLLGTRYYGYIAKSVNGGSAWKAVASQDNEEFPFVTKLANARQYPDRVLTVGRKGVYVSEDFGDTWTLRPIATNFVIGSALYLDVEVSHANPNIIWAGSGMNNSDNIRYLFVSKDGGKTFQRTNNYEQVTLGNITRLATHPVQNETAYALFSFADGPKVLRTTDLGQTWEDISGFGTSASSTNGFPDVAVYCLYVRPDNPNILWVGTEIGIVESTDNGQSWALIENFPNVAVWDMKGQDNEVVIATHGRGIWTAKLSAPQTSASPIEVIAAGTSPTGRFAARIHAKLPFDSVHVYANHQKVRTLKTVVSATHDLQLDNIVPGKTEIKLMAFSAGVPAQSKVFATDHYTLLQQRNAYTTYFRSLSDVVVSGLTLQSLDGPVKPLKQSLQTNHFYTPGEKYELFIRTPIKVSSTVPQVFYRDIAVVEPGHDAVILEATRNGLDWISLQSYDANLNELWQSAFSAGQNGANNMYVNHTVDYSDVFSADEVVLFRMRLVSNETITGWGWALENISIQETPVDAEQKPEFEIDIYPNPASDVVKIQLPESISEARVSIFNSFGSRVFHETLNPKVNEPNTIEVSKLSRGTYLISLESKDHRLTRKVILR